MLSSLVLRACVGADRIRAVDLRKELVVLETDRYRVAGNLTLPGEGYRSRLSDYLNNPEREFIPVSDATITSLDDPESSDQIPLVMIARRHVRLVRPTQAEAEE